MSMRSQQRRLRRRGLSSLALVLAFAAIVALIALGVDVGLLVQRHKQLKIAGEAAALAAAHELFSPRLAGVSIDREEIARQAALNFAAANIVSDQPLKLSRNRTNDPLGDVVLGWTAPPELLSPFQPRTRQQPQVNSLLVRTRHSQTGRTGPVLMFGRIIGMTGNNIKTESIAAVDHRVYGFRPVHCTNVPLVPLLIESPTWGRADGEDLEDELDEQEGEHGSSHQNPQPGEGQDQTPAAIDRFTVDPRLGIVTSGGDGIPELRITLGRRQQGGGQQGGNNGHGGHDENHPDNGHHDDEQDGNSAAHRHHLRRPLPAWLIDFTGDTDHLAAALTHEIQWGLAPLDLVSHNGEIRLGNLVACQSLGAAASNGVAVGELQTALQSIIGQPRLFALGAVTGPEAGGGDLAGGLIANFVGGVIVESQVNGNSLTIHIQPVLLNSCTTIVREDAEGNPWIGKIVLVR
jgi:hypothetical protein